MKMQCTKQRDFLVVVLRDATPSLPAHAREGGGKRWPKPPLSPPPPPRHPLLSSVLIYSPLPLLHLPDPPGPCPPLSFLSTTVYPQRRPPSVPTTDPSNQQAGVAWRLSRKPRKTRCVAPYTQ